MSTSVKSLYSITGSVETDEITAHVILDKKNNYIHIHFYGKFFSSTQKSISVKHANAKFPEDEGIDLVKRIVVREFANKKVQIKNIRIEKENPVKKSKPAQRTIIRFKK
jgi:hypothetical protein